MGRRTKRSCAKARNQDSGPPGGTTRPLDARSIRGRRGGYCARENVVEEEIHASETVEEAVARGGACREGWARAKIREGTNVSENFGNDSSRKSLHGGCCRSRPRCI